MRNWVALRVLPPVFMSMSTMYAHAYDGYAADDGCASVHRGAAAVSAYVTMMVEGLAETKGSWTSLGRGRMKSDNPREKAWATHVGWVAKLMMRGKLPLTSALVTLDFVLPPAKGRKNQRDIDKLARSCLDAMNKIVYVDDENVRTLISHKEIGARPMVEINVFEPLGVRAADLVKFWIDEHNAYRQIGTTIRRTT